MASYAPVCRSLINNDPTYNCPFASIEILYWGLVTWDVCSPYLSICIIIKIETSHRLRRAGEMELKKKKIKRRFVRRVLMGPASSFTAELINDELQTTGLSVWGMILHDAYPVAVDEFLTLNGLSQLDQAVHIGRLRQFAPSELADGTTWLSSGFLRFAPDIEASVLWKLQLWPQGLG